MRPQRNRRFLTIPPGREVVIREEFTRDNTLEKIYIPASVKCIRPCAFSFCIRLSLVSFKSNGIETLCHNAFTMCSSLKKITLPSSIVTVGERSFSACSNLEVVTFETPLKLDYIGPRAFTECRALQRIDLSMATELGRISVFCFSHCSSLETVTFPEKLIYIECRAFFKCTSLSYVAIPQTVRRVGSSAFAECSSLEKVRFDNNQCIVGNGCFDGCVALKKVIVRDINCLRRLFGRSECFDRCDSLLGFDFVNEFNPRILPHVIAALSNDTRRAMKVIFPTTAHKRTWSLMITKFILKKKFAGSNGYNSL